MKNRMVLFSFLLLTSFAFANDCPVQKLKATLICEGAQNELKFSSHEGKYSLKKEDIFKDMTGNEELECTYEPSSIISEHIKPWQSIYSKNGKTIRIQFIEALSPLIDSLSEIDKKDKETARKNIHEPQVKLNYRLSWFRVKKELAHKYIHVGLGHHWDEFLDGDETPKHLSFVIDETAWGAGFGGSYTLGTKCSFNIEVLD